MKRQHPLLLVLLITYVLMPNVLVWATDINGHWYRPFIVWLVVIIAAYGLQRWKKLNDV